MKVRLICYEDVHAWILGKFALRMHDCLKRLGIESDIAKIPDNSAEINHHIIYGGYDGKKHAIDTLMITHIDNIDKLNLVKHQLKVASAGICMSSETMEYLTKMGVEKGKLCYVNPAHDGVMPTKKIIIGLACRVQEDGRKREYFLDNLAKVLNANYFKFKIMGDGWDRQVNNLRKSGFEVDYFDHFDYSEYIRFIPSLDYYLYMGVDEGQMGLIDALAAGVKTIVTVQGYHLDAQNGIVHPFTSYEELESIFLLLEDEKEALINSVSTWNWLDYTKKHVEIWHYLLDYKKDKSNFTDGLNSLLNSKKHDVSHDNSFVRAKTSELRKAKYLHFFRSKKRKSKEILKSQGFLGLISAIVNRILRK